MEDVTGRVEFYNFRDNQHRTDTLNESQFKSVAEGGDVEAVYRDSDTTVYVKSRRLRRVMNLLDFMDYWEVNCDVRWKKIPATSPQAPATV